LLPDNSYLDGYWQSHRYFERISNLLHDEFKLKEDSVEHNYGLECEIKDSTSIGVHIRRGDYVTNIKSAKYHGICSMDYYNDSFEYMSKIISNPKYFIFSDDINWAINNIKINYPIRFISTNMKIPHYDLSLLSLCKHQIIANSSFSWWAAWLNKNLNKIVIAPKKWFTKDKDANDLCPTNWIKL
jgi:hypothetical protein